MYFKNIFFISVLMGTIHCKKNPNPAMDKNGDGSVQLLDRAIDLHPFEDSLYFMRAKYHYEQGAYDLSIQDLKYAIKLDSLEPSYYHLLADAYLDNKQSYEALSTLNQASLIFPLRIATLLKLCEFQHILKQYPASLMTTQRIQSIDPLNTESFFMAGLNYRDMMDTIQAISKLQYATSLDDRHIDAWIVLGQLTQNKNPTMALQYFENAVQVDTTNISALHSLAGFLQDRGNLGQSLDIYKKIINLDPDYTDAFVHTGLIYFSIDSLVKALNAFDILCKQDATNPAYYFYRGSAYEALGNTPAAKSDYQQALRLDPFHRKAKSALDKIK